MDNRICALIDYTKSKFGLNNYFLKRHELYRDVNMFNETEYTLSMEWFPNHITDDEGDEDLNPKGTAVIDVNVQDRTFNSVVFVEGVSYANGIIFSDYDTQDIIKWIEKETGLTYDKHFQLYKEETGMFHFTACQDGVAISPAGSIELKYDSEGKLTRFAVHGHFSNQAPLLKETYALSIEKIKGLPKEQLKLITLPDETDTLHHVYTIEEIYVRNANMETMPFEVALDEHAYCQIDKTLSWDTPIHKSFESKDVDWDEHITAEQAYASEPSPDAFSISKNEQTTCLVNVTDFLRQVYPDDTGKWMIKTLHRDKGYIHATLRLNKHQSQFIKRKLTIIIDRKSLQVLNYVDNKPMLEIFDEFDEPEEATHSNTEAYEIIKNKIELTPCYVYDFEQEQYVLCGKLDCDYGVDAVSGELFSVEAI